MSLSRESSGAAMLRRGTTVLTPPRSQRPGDSNSAVSARTPRKPHRREKIGQQQAEWHSSEVEVRCHTAERISPSRSKAVFVRSFLGSFLSGLSSVSDEATSSSSSKPAAVAVPFQKGAQLQVPFLRDYHLNSCNTDCLMCNLY